MAEPFVGQLSLFACNFAPLNWLMCQGQLLPIRQYTALFALLGTNYGGNGVSTFGLPDLRSRVPVGQGVLAGGSDDYLMGETGGVEQVALTMATIPAHSHAFPAYSVAATTKSPTGALPALGPSSGGHGAGTSMHIYNSAAPNVALRAAQVNPVQGGGLPHGNVQPSLALNWCISLEGVFPPRQ